MGPPISTWPYSHSVPELTSDSDISKLANDIQNRRRSGYRAICVNFIVAAVLCHAVVNLGCVRAGPVILNMDYMQGPVPLARNIRHLPCVSRRTGQEGLCMFAIDCLKANGSHLGTCIDRFYFGSCCQVPDKTVIPQILTNHIDDNSIDNANFVHPQPETHHKIPEIFGTKKPTTQKIETTTREAEKTESLELETKSDEQTTIDNRIINDEKVTTAVVVETTTKLSENTDRPVTEVPIKLSTFQTVSGSASPTSSTEKTTQDKTEEETTVTSTTTKKPTRKPVRPFTRPTHKPYNTTRPLYTLSTLKPKPPIALYNTTRKPPYRPPPNRPSTKKPFPIPPRLNITILPQSTSSKPLLTRPSSVSITYINPTQTTKEEPKVTTTTSTTTPSTTTTEKIVETTEAVETTVLTTETQTEKTEKTTEAVVETISTESEKETTVNVEKDTTSQDIEKESGTETNNNKDSTNQETENQREPVKESTNTEPTDDKETPNQDEQKETTPEITNETTEKVSEKETTVQEEEKPSTVQEIATEKEILKPATESDIPLTVSEVTSTTDYPPLMTWTNTVDAVTKAPEKVTEPSDDIWSPITPPEGWILLSTIKPTTSTTTEAPTTQPATTQQETTVKVVETTEKIEPMTEITQEPLQPVLTTLSTTEATTTQTTLSSSSTAEPTTQSSTQPTTQELLEFTVNVTLTPTVPTSTSSIGLTTFSSVSTVDNSTKANETETTLAANVTEAPTTTITEFSLESLGNDKNDYKKVCGRRLWQAPTGRIVGGDKSGFGMWPWQISLRQYRTSTYLHKCGAALLNENWAITAAHCVEHVPPSDLLVRLGEHDLATEDEPYGFAERRVQIVASHPHFDSATFEYDLALLRFYEPVKFQPNILPICVPDSDEDFVGKTAFVTGWGRLYDEGPLPSVLQEVKVPVINNSACEAMYQAAGYNEHIPHIFICAGRSKGGTDSCEGDSGGPMVIPREKDGRFVLSGIISWGIGCAEPNQPGVYTRISEFRDWINQILQF